MPFSYLMVNMTNNNTRELPCNTVCHGNHANTQSYTVYIFILFSVPRCTSLSTGCYRSFIIIGLHIECDLSWSWCCALQVPIIITKTKSCLSSKYLLSATKVQRKRNPKLSKVMGKRKRWLGLNHAIPTQHWRSFICDTQHWPNFTCDTHITSLCMFPKHRHNFMLLLQLECFNSLLVTTTIYSK